jgi:D-arabinose 1-dehydrogenase-like Zn-dependent alcohol dehydrogenase
MDLQHDLPATHNALMQKVYAEPLEVMTIPTPQPTAGSVIVRIEYANIVSYMRDIYNGTRKYPYPTPLVTGSSAIGRIAALGPDAVKLQVGDLVFVDSTIRGRDDPGAIILSGIVSGSTERSRKLMAGEWRDSTYAEYAKVPLENCHVLDETRLCGSVEDGGLGYNIDQLPGISGPLVPYGGFRSINLQAGETVIVAPATGQFGRAAVRVALAMGARVIAMGRNTEVLESLKELSNRVSTVRIVGNAELEMEQLKKFGPIDAYLDLSPSAAENSTHIKASILSLRPEGRASLMGGLLGDVAIPHMFIMRHGISLIGKWMYYRHDVSAFIRMVELGVFSLSHVNVTGAYPLDQWEDAFGAAAREAGSGRTVLMNPRI